MSQIFKLHHVLLILTVLSNLLFANTATASTDNGCADATPVDLDDTYRGYINDRNTTEILVLDVPASGIATLDVSVPGAALVEPKLGSLGRYCAANSVDADVAMVERSLTHQTIAFRSAGRYFFRVAAQDPRLALAEYKLQTRFVAAETIDRELAELKTQRDSLLVSQTDFFLDGSALKSEVGEVDPDPETRSSANGPALRLVTLYAADPAKSEVGEVDPDPEARGSYLGRLTARMLVFEAASFPTTVAHSEVGEVDPDPEVNREVDPQKSEVGEVDPDPEATFVGSRILNSVLTTYAANAPKSEVGEVDPDPEATYGADPQKSEVGEVDPDPEARGSVAAVAISRLTFTFQDLEPTRNDDLSLLRWLADLTWPGAAVASGDTTGRYKLLAHDRDADSASDTFRLAILCQQELDDRGDTFDCATALEDRSRVAGSIDNAWGDDSDTFTFMVSEPTTVRIETAGDTDTFGVLYDSSGRRLAGDDDAGAGGNFQIVETLAAGRYFLRVEGANRSEGNFELNYETLGW